MRVPRGWSATTLGEIGTYLNGRGFRKTEWSASGRPIIRIQNLTGTRGLLHEEVTFDLWGREVLLEGC